MPIFNTPNLDELEEVHDEDDDLLLAGSPNDFAIGDESGAFRIRPPQGDWGEADLSISKEEPTHQQQRRAPVVIPSLMPVPVTRPMMNAVRTAHVESSEAEAQRRRAFEAAAKIEIEMPPVAPPVLRPMSVPRPQPQAPSLAPPPKADAGPKRYGTLKMEAVVPQAAAAPPPPAPAPAHDAPPSTGRMLDEVDWATAPSIDLELSALPSGQMKAAAAASTETMAGLPTLSNTSSSSNSGVVRFAVPPHDGTQTPLELLGAPPSAPRSASREMLAVRTPSREMQAVQHDPNLPPSSSSSSSAAGTVARASTSNGSAPEDKRRPGVYAFAGYGVAPTSWIDAPTYALRVIARRRVLPRELEVARKRRGRTDEVELYEEALHTADEAAYSKGMAVLGLIIGLAAAAVITAIVFMLA